MDGKKYIRKRKILAQKKIESGLLPSRCELSEIIHLCEPDQGFEMPVIIAFLQADKSIEDIAA